jgi:outer membrane protein OmpA-like peptidoglycan-associated protein
LAVAATLAAEPVRRPERRPSRRLLVAGLGVAALAAAALLWLGGRPSKSPVAGAASAPTAVVAPASAATVALGTAVDLAPPPPASTAPPPPAPSASAETVPVARAQTGDPRSLAGARFPGAFPRNATEPTGFTAAEVDALVAELQRCPTDVVLVGHACSLGDESTNQGLGWLRADAVRRILVARGVDAARIRVRTAGSNGALATNDSEERRLVNRRVMVMCSAR